MVSNRQELARRLTIAQGKAAHDPTPENKAAVKALEAQYKRAVASEESAALIALQAPLRRKDNVAGG